LHKNIFKTLEKTALKIRFQYVFVERFRKFRRK